MSLNIPNITKVRDTIAALEPDRFDMAHWASRIEDGGFASPSDLLHNCGTCGCIGGWTEALFEDPAPVALGLDRQQEFDLFYPAGEGIISSYGDVTQAHAVTTLTKLIETGEVDWSHVPSDFNG
jgi:hypothetical protein